MTDRNYNLLEAIEELNNLYKEDELIEGNNNFGSDRAKTALVKKWLGNGAEPQEVRDTKARSILHHLNGNHNDDKDLANDVLIVANDKEDAKLAHKLLHLLSYCYIRNELESKLKSLDVEFYFHPDYSAEPQPISIEALAAGLVEHDKRLRDIALIDQDAEDLDSVGSNNFEIND